MESLPTLPRRSWLERTSLSLATTLAIVAGLTLIGWWLEFDELLQPFPGYAPMHVNASLGFLVLSGVLLALGFGRRQVALLALIPSAIGALTLAETLFKKNLPFDELLAPDRLLIGTEQPGRMPAMVAVCLVLGGLVLAWRASKRAAGARLFTEAVTGSVLASAGISTLLGYAANLPAVFRWGSTSATSPVAAIALILFGHALLLLAWRGSLKAVGEPPAWSPMPVVIGCLTLTVILRIGLGEREDAYLAAKTRSVMDSLARTISVALDKESSQLERLARGWGSSPPDAYALWEADATKPMLESRDFGVVSFAFVDLGLHTRWIYPRAGNEGSIGFNHATDEERQAALTAARTSGTAAISDTTKVPVPDQGLKPGAAIYAPILRAGQLAGYAPAELYYEKLFRTATAQRQTIDQLDTNYHLVIALGGKRIFSSDATDPTRHDELTIDHTYTIANRRIRLSLTPSNTALAADRRYLPQLALGAGVGITVLLGLSVHLARGARAGQRAAESSNKKLFAENEERRRVEARLKVSDERLRLALDSTQIGIFEWSVPAGHVYYSPGLWAMLGFEHLRMPSTVEVWQSLIHPDDLALYRRRTESQLTGIATFIEPEYRVRARSGDWRWVYTRSKSVATATDGRPTRIIGTVQDITARREAELALRESQAEARKLSLVAAKTDNPVLIGSPDGKIEWANEAFCRVMEYSLTDVVGRNPAQFMVGPDTSLRTIARIRTAMARGQGISTDVVNYSKSGRKYHLHLEVEPVHGASGEIVNFIAVETDITARVETEIQLRRAKSEADDASRAKSEFLASMSHEIRTPMNGVIGMTSLLMETTLNPEQRDYVNTIRSSGDALLTIINDILDFSKIESGKMELERAPFELALCVEEALDLFALQASAKKVELGYHLDPDVPGWIMGDVTRLRQVIVNLVNNAVKFTPSGSISVQARRVVRDPTPLGFASAVDADPSHFLLEFTVRDTGIGIPADRVDRLFKAFSQVDSSTTRKYGGTGLGLAISQRICQLMGGAIRVESAPGTGSAFIFTLKTEPAALTPDTGLPPLPAPLRGGTVLCVEDHPLTQARLRSLFERWGTACVVVDTITAALAATAQLTRPPALLVLESDETESPSPLAALAALAAIKCPRLILFPFGQTAPTPPEPADRAAPDDDLPFASTSKPLRTTPLVHAVISLFNPASATTHAKAADRPLAEEFPLDVLLAEDNAVNQKVALRFLERMGYRADAVGNGLEVLSTLGTHRYDLILMDLQMPEMDGLEATRQIRTRFPADRQPKIVALTANAMQGDREACLAAGMDDYISKPVKMHEISAAIRRQFGKRAGTRRAPQVIG